LVCRSEQKKGEKIINSRVIRRIGDVACGALRYYGQRVKGHNSAEAGANGVKRRGEDGIARKSDGLRRRPVKESIREWKEGRRGAMKTQDPRPRFEVKASGE